MLDSTTTYIIRADDIGSPTAYTMMLSLSDAMLEFYPKEILKIQGRISRFNEAKSYWQNKNDIWI